MLQDHLQTLRDPEKHKHRRTMWDRGLNAKCNSTFLERFIWLLTNESMPDIPPQVEQNLFAVRRESQRTSGPTYFYQRLVSLCDLRHHGRNRVW